MVERLELRMTMPAADAEGLHNLLQIMFSLNSERMHNPFHLLAEEYEHIAVW